MSDQPMIERTEAGKTKLRLEFPPIAPPKKITEGDIGTAVKGVIGRAEEDRPPSQTETMLTPTADAFIQSANAITLSRLKKLVLEKARYALGLSAQKAALTASGLYLLVSSGCGNIKNPSINAPTIKEPTPVSATKTPEYRYLSKDNIQIAIDKEGLPVEYVLPDGKKGNFDRGEVRQIREKAIYSKEPEIITVLPFENTISKSLEHEYTSSIEHPRIRELPQDVLSEEELKKRGVKIIQADRTNLYIREGAFENDSPLANFNNTGRNLTIVLVDGPTVDPHYMNDSRYAEVKKIFPNADETVEEYKTYEIALRENDLNNYRKALKEMLKTSNPSQNEIVNYENRIVFAKMDLFKYKNILTGNDTFDYKVLTAYDLTSAGLYRREQNPIVFIAVGKRDIPDFAGIYFDSKGTFKIRIGRGSGHTVPVRADQTHPNPEVAATGRGFTLRHELAHDQLTTQKINRGETPIFSEDSADIKALESIRSAWEKWEKSGFTDNSGYYFVFSLPEGGYILTENKPSSGPTVLDRL